MVVQDAFSRNSVRKPLCQRFDRPIDSSGDLNYNHINYKVKDVTESKIVSPSITRNLSRRHSAMSSMNCLKGQVLMTR